jgi:biopolymer transport protein ExbD
MKALPILFAFSLCTSSTFAELPSLESLALKVEALEREVQALKADLDAAKKAKDGEQDSDISKRPEIIINILKDGSIRVEGQKLRDEELVERIGAALKQFPNQPIRIRADGEVKYQEVVRVVDLCQRAGGWNLSFATGKTKDEQAGSSTGG